MWRTARVTNENPPIPSSMTSYNFETREFAVSDAGIHLLRDRYNYRTIRFSEIKQIVIGKGKETPNWIGAFMLGTAIIYAAIDFSMITFDGFISGNGNMWQVQMFVFLLLIGCAGGCFVYSSLQQGLILRISYANGKRDRFPLREIIMQDRFDDLLFMLTSKLDSRIIVKLKKKPRRQISSAGRLG
jgi:hypothetical protein